MKNLLSQVTNEMALYRFTKDEFPDMKTVRSWFPNEKEGTINRHYSTAKQKITDCNRRFEELEHMYDIHREDMKSATVFGIFLGTGLGIFVSIITSLIF